MLGAQGRLGMLACLRVQAWKKGSVERDRGVEGESAAGTERIREAFLWPVSGLAIGGSWMEASGSAGRMSSQAFVLQ